MSQKTKKCAVCESEFTIYRSTDKYCSPKCAREGAKLNKKKKEKKKPKTKKTVPISKLHDKAATLLQKLVRMRAADDNGIATCITCGKREHWKELQGGHWIERGKHATKLDERNVHPQCRYDNKWGMGKTSVVLKYREKLVEMYGEESVQDLESLPYKPFKWNRLELNELIEKYQQEIKELEEKLQ